MHFDVMHLDPLKVTPFPDLKIAKTVLFESSVAGFKKQYWSLPISFFCIAKYLQKNNLEVKNIFLTRGSIKLTLIKFVLYTTCFQIYAKFLQSHIYFKQTNIKPAVFPNFHQRWIKLKKSSFIARFARRLSKLNRDSNII